MTIAEQITRGESPLPPCQDVSAATPVRTKILRTIDECAPLIRKRLPFRTRIRKTAYGEFISMRGRSDYVGRGHLPEAYLPSLHHSEYVVYSYDTPIAWWNPIPADLGNLYTVESWLDGDEVGQWIMPEVRYTITTTSHQAEVRSALGGYGGSWQANWKPREPIPLTQLVIPGAPVRVEYVGCERTAY